MTFLTKRKPISFLYMSDSHGIQSNGTGLILTAQRYLPNSNLTTTMRNYTHLAEEMERMVAEKVSRAFGNMSTPLICLNYWNNGVKLYREISANCEWNRNKLHCVRNRSC